MNERSPPLKPSVLDAFRSRLRGTLCLPGDPNYDIARSVWNGAIDRHPSCVIGCADAEDVSHAVRVAADHGLAMTIRGGGHNVAGRSIRDGALLRRTRRSCVHQAMGNPVPGSQELHRKIHHQPIVAGREDTRPARSDQRNDNGHAYHRRNHYRSSGIAANRPFTRPTREGAPTWAYSYKIRGKCARKIACLASGGSAALDDPLLAEEFISSAKSTISRLAQVLMAKY